MRIAFFELYKIEQDIVEESLSGQTVSCFEEKLNEENIDKAIDAEVVSVFINSQLDKNILSKLPNLKFITTRSTGYDHIDHNFAKEKGIGISNVPAYGSHTVAEFTFALLLNLSRKISNASNNLKLYSDFDALSLVGFDLLGKTIGVVGTGKIGKNVIMIAKGFGMNVIAHDLYKDEAYAQKFDFEYKTLEEVLSQSDIITLHIPYTKENYHLINKEKISLMKKGVYLINTARGELIDTSALICGLKEGIIAGAGLDVLEGERELKEEFEILGDAARANKIKDYRTLLEDHILIDMPNVVVTPHIAYDSIKAREEILKITVENIKSFIEGNPVNLIK